MTTTRSKKSCTGRTPLWTQLPTGTAPGAASIWKAPMYGGRHIIGSATSMARPADHLPKKAQLAYYEDVRAQYEAYATHWSNRKMVMHWMMNSPWPSFFGHLFDYYFKQGGGYFGAKKAMRPVSVVWDYYATADRSTAHVYAVNQTTEPLQHVNVSVAFYNVDGARKYVNETKDIEVAPYSSLAAFSPKTLTGNPQRTTTWAVLTMMTSSRLSS